MQLSAPSFPFNVNSAGPATASAGKPADSATSAAPAFGELLNAETKASPSPASRAGTMGANKRTVEMAAEKMSGDIAEDDSSDSDDLLASDDQSSSQGVAGSWLSTNGIVQNPTLVQTLNYFNVARPTDANEITEATEASADQSQPANISISPDASVVSGGIIQNSGLPTVPTGEDLVGSPESALGKISAPGSRAAGEFTTGAANSNSIQRNGVVSSSNEELVSTPQPNNDAGDSPVPVDALADSSGDATALADRTGNDLLANTDSTTAPATTDRTGNSGSDDSTLGTAAEDKAAGELNLVASQVETETTDPLSEVPGGESVVDSGVIDADASNQPRRLSASANSVRVHAAIDQARLLNVPPASLVAEKFAGPADRITEALRSTEKGGQRKLFESGQQQVATSYVPVGINVAKEEASMPALATATPPTSSPTESISASASPVSFESLIKADTAEAGLASGARRAVESAVAMAERFSNADRSSVNLQFNVSGVDLAVRVQMKADGVHTTFRTDSPELRAALAQEWHSVAAQTPDRAVRLADPTFSSHTSDSSLQSDAGSRHDRDSSARNSQSFSDQFSSARGGARLPSSVAPVISTAPVATSASGRLHAFA